MRQRFRRELVWPVRAPANRSTGALRERVVHDDRVRLYAHLHPRPRTARSCGRSARLCRVGKQHAVSARSGFLRDRLFSGVRTLVARPGSPVVSPRVVRGAQARTGSRKPVARRSGGRRESPMIIADPHAPTPVHPPGARDALLSDISQPRRRALYRRRDPGRSPQPSPVVWAASPGHGQIHAGRGEG